MFVHPADPLKGGKQNGYKTKGNLGAWVGALAEKESQTE
jgi:hypothetical protein